MWVSDIGRVAAQVLKLGGVLVIALGAGTAFVRALLSWARRLEAYRTLRERVGKAVLLGLELLVGADIIRTMTTEPELDRVVVLAVVVLLRTFLSVSLETELEGRWPWNRH